MLRVGGLLAGVGLVLALLFDSGLALFGGVFIAAGGIVLALAMEPGWTNVDPDT